VDDFPLNELDRLPYVDAAPEDGRKVLLQKSYFDDKTGEWHLYFIPRDGQIGRLAGGEAVYGSYLARSPADPARDVELTISTLITQHLSFPGLLDRVQRFENDAQNCAAVLEKYHLISALHARGDYTRVLITTELEYLLALVRSMYDLLHNVVKDIAPLFITLTDDRQRVVKKKLPNSFADVALHGEDLVPGGEIVGKRGLPPQLANWYVREGPAFRMLRSARDAVIHRGVHLLEVYDIPDHGLAVGKDGWPWSEFAFWEGVEPVNERLVPLRMAFAAIVNHVLGASERLVDAIASFTSLPAPIGKGVRVYLRSAVTHRLLEIPQMLQTPWERLNNGVGGDGRVTASG
jgi:hypothetical protein